MCKFTLKWLSCLLGFALIMNHVSSEEPINSAKKTLEAGTTMLSAEKHLDIKQSRLEQSTQENPRAKQVNKMYLTTHPLASHGVYKTIPPYNRVELSDGSIWHVWYSSHWETVNRWKYYNDQVIICPGTFFDPTDYILVSQRTGEVVPVNLIEMEVVFGDPYFKGQRVWIEHINYMFDLACGCYYYEIILNDGSVWEVDYRDDYLASFMQPGDVIIMGVDESFGSSTYNILINFNTLEYVHADCVAR